MRHAHQGVRHSRSRIAPDTEVGLEVDGLMRRARILDVSLSGVRLAAPQDCRPLPGSAARLSFPIEGQAPLLLDAALVRAGEGELAYRFELPGLAQQDALRALIARRGRLLDVLEE